MRDAPAERDNSPDDRLGKESSYRQIVRSTSIFGGVGIITISLGILRNKLAAILIGPAGVGTMGIYAALITLMSTLCGLGMHQSGVQAIAGAQSGDDRFLVGRKIRSLRWAGKVLAVGGVLVQLLLAGLLSQSYFRDGEHRPSIAILSVCVALTILGATEGAILQGLRRVRDLATANLATSLAGAIATVVLLAVLGRSGIVPAVVASAVAVTLGLAWKTRGVTGTTSKIPWRDSLQDARGMAGLGLAMVGGGLLATVVGSIGLSIVSRELGEASVGHYIAAWTVSNVYVGFVLNAMATDFYPRLAEAANDPLRLRQLVNEQTEIGVLIATPGILFALIWNQYLIPVLYTADFAPATAVMHWQILGMFLRVVTWPLGYVALATAKTKLHLLTELFMNALHVALIWLGVKWFGLVGIGIAFFALYSVYFFVVKLTVKAIVDFSYSGRALKQLVLCGAGILLGAVIARPSLGLAGMVAGNLLWLVFSACCLWKLYTLVPDFRLFIMAERIFKRRKI